MIVNLSKSFGLVAAFLLILALTCVSGLAQESRQRVIRQARTEPGRQSPLKVVSVTVKGEAVEPGRHFAAGDDWLLGLTFRVKNVSDKPISFVDVSLQFPTPAGHKNKFVHMVGPLRYGCWLGTPCYADAGGSHSEIMPGETRDVRLSEERYRSLMNALARSGASTPVEAAEYDIDSVSFDEDTRWSRGYLFKRDPLDGNSYKMADKYEPPKKP
jgi:hypothetical protein